MKIPQNGTPFANCLLLAGGLIVGYAAGHWRPLTHRAGPAVLENSTLVQLPPAATSGNIRATNTKRSGDAAGVLATAAKQPETTRLQTLRDFYGNWATTDPAAAAAHALQHLKPGSSLSESLTVIARQWGTADARTAWQWSADGVTGPLKTQLQTAILQGWAGRDPAGAAHWLAGSGLTSQPFYDIVASTWAASNPVAAVDWAKKLPDPHTRSTAEVGTAREIAATDPATAANLFADIISPPDTGTDPTSDPVVPGAESLNLATAIADLWATTDPAAAAAWIASLPSGPGRDEASATLATVWAASDINSAIAWSDQISDPAMRRNVIAHLATTWGAIEPDQALAWLGRLPPADAAMGNEGALHSWAATDPAGLGDWLKNTISSPLTDIARLALGDILTDTDLPRSMDLALGITSDSQRESAVTRFYHKWRKTDPESAAEWRDVQWPNFPETTRQNLLKQEGRTVVTP